MTSAPPTDLVETVESVLQRVLSPQHLTVEDDSADHAGHAEAGNGSHLSVQIVAQCFVGKTPLQRHRLVYAALGDLSALGVHALAITASAPTA